MLVTLSGMTRFVTRALLRYNFAPVFNGFAADELKEILHHAAISVI